MQLKNQYIPEIDGLRGLSVALVLIFHVGFLWLPGGFVGVDVFFVISGYLITKQILRQLSEGRFTFSEFYIRRIRRLAPALMVTIAGTLILGFALLSLSDFERLGSMALAALFGFSNFYFSGKVDYFSNDAAADPLLHFWSLAVEEQYYLVAPLMALLSYSRYSFRGVLYACALIFLSSFLAAVLLYDEITRVVFFWPFFRAWELAFGAMLLWFFQPGRMTSVFATLGGAALILFSALFFTAAIGGWAVANLIPCVGAALVIVAADNPAKRIIFGNPVSVALGRISYSLYLVHWPIIVYILYLQTGDHLSASNKIFAIILSIIAACLLYKFVEQHFRFSQSPSKANGSRKFLLGILASVLMLTALSLAIAFGSGWQWRLSSKVVHDGEGYGACKWETFCELGAGGWGEHSPELILIGDSHAKHLSAGLSRWVKNRNSTALAVTSPSCAPIASLPLPKVDSKACKSIRMKLQNILDQNPSAIVVVVQRWGGYPQVDQILDGYSNFLKNRPDNSVLFVGQGPELPASKTQCGTKHAILLPKDACSLYLRAENTKKLNQTLANFAKQNNFRFVDPHDQLCDDKGCVVELDGYAVFIDRQHISNYASEFLVEKYLAQFPSLKLQKGGE